MATMNVSLPESLRAWVESQTESGTYGNASEYIRDPIHKDQQRHEAVATLQAAITAGVQSGEPSPLGAKLDWVMALRTAYSSS